jgi:hypothetical protein
MPPYRIYRRDTAGRIDGPADLVECDDDTATLDYARGKAKGRSVEIWQGERLVAVISDDSF